MPVPEVFAVSGGTACPAPGSAEDGPGNADADCTGAAACAFCKASCCCCNCCSICSWCCISAWFWSASFFSCISTASNCSCSALICCSSVFLLFGSAAWATVAAPRAQAASTAALRVARLFLLVKCIKRLLRTCYGLTLSGYVVGGRIVRIESVRQRAQEQHEIVDLLRCHRWTVAARDGGRRIRHLAGIHVGVVSDWQVVVLIQVGRAIRGCEERADRLIGIAAGTCRHGGRIVARVVVDIAGDVPLHGLVDLGKHAVVEVRSGQRDVAQRGHLELTARGDQPGEIRARASILRVGH